MQQLNIQSNIERKTMYKLINQNLKQKIDDNELSLHLLDLLGENNIEVVVELIQNREYYTNHNYDMIIEECVELIVEIAKISPQEAMDHLNKYNYDLDYAINQLYINKQKKIENQQQFFIITENTNQLEFEEDKYQIDLHQKSFQKAMEFVRTTINKLVNKLVKMKKQSTIELIIITGRGNHSVGNWPILKISVLKLLQAHNIAYVLDSQTKGGQIIVTIQKDTHLI
ncbi:Conserved_hypothetical protein [Hexamita inflata]|uniref:Smr domain-containing protein n=1 Tax=Hexamita inflata TaxID=28002 RepID=A0AA86RBS0_9EUKA|nr:Conserved hypothetical protein [Hexamita inflata]